MDLTRRNGLTRRRLLQRIAMGLSCTPALIHAPRALAADPLPLLETDPEAIKVQYVEEAGRAPQAQSGANCANCSVYTARGDSAGTCGTINNRLVKAAGWCNAWSGL
jgi:hypothetical protein